MTPRSSGANAARPLNAATGCLGCALRRVCLPAELTEAEIARFDALVERPPTVEAGVDLLMPGVPLERIFILRVGHLQEFVARDGGERRITGYTLPGDMLGFDGFATQTHVIGARSLETVALCQVGAGGLMELAAQLPRLLEQVLQRISQRLLSTLRLQLVVARHTARERVAAMLLSHSERAERIRWSTTRLRLPMSYGDIAASLGISAAALSRTLHQMAEEGLITIDRSEIEIVDVERLVRAADGPAEAIPPVAM